MRPGGWGMKPRVFVFGSINTDLVVYVERFPRHGETVSDGRFASHPGGKGANQAVAAARSGADVTLHGCLGDDAFGRERLAALAQAGISTRGVRLVPGLHSGIAAITVDSHGENTIAVAPGANLGFTPDGVEIPAAAPGQRHVSLFQNEIPEQTTRELIRRASAAGHTVIWNLAPVIRRAPDPATLAAVSYLICNANELAALTGGEGRPLEDAARAPLAWGVPNVIVTLGREGAVWASASGVFRQDAFPVTAVDTVGAGDCYCGVFAAAIGEGLAAQDALRRASAAAAISCTRQGAQDSMPRREEVDEFLASRR
jgi:ribokinase